MQKNGARPRRIILYLLGHRNVRAALPRRHARVGAAAARDRVARERARKGGAVSRGRRRGCARSRNCAARSHPSRPPSARPAPTALALPAVTAAEAEASDSPLGATAIDEGAGADAIAAFVDAVCVPHATPPAHRRRRRRDDAALI